MESAILRRNKAGSLRSRDTASNDADAGEDDSGVSPQTLVTKLKAKSRTKPKARLSFNNEEEEGEPTFQVGEKSAKASGYIPTPDTSTSSPGLYSKAALAELKASTPSTRAPKLAEDEDITMSLDLSELDGAQIDPQELLLMQNHDLVDTPMLGIPSSSSITAAKEKRERLRASGNDRSGDFISLSVMRKEDVVDRGPHPTSRLMREDDILGEGEEDMAEYTGATERIALGKRAKKEEKNKRRQGMMDMIEDVAEDDVANEEDMEWELAQIRRTGALVEAVKPAKATYVPSPVPLATQIPTLAAASARLTQILTSVTTSHATSSAAMVSLAEEQDTLQKRETEMRDMIGKAEDKRAWFVGFRERLEGVGAFLDEKFPSLEEHEKEHITLLKERFDMIANKRALDDADDVALFLGPPALYDASEANTRLMHRLNLTTAPPDSDSLLSFIPSEVAADYTVATQYLVSRATASLADVQSPSFRDPREGIAKWFAQWRDDPRWEESYRGAWGGLGLVAAWEFWARWEIIGWEGGLDGQDRRTLHDFQWYSSLYEYSRPQQAREDDSSAMEEEPEVGPDGDLTGALVSTAIVPRLVAMIQGGALDPYSTRQVIRLVDVVEQVEASGVESDGIRFKSLLSAPLPVFRAAIERTVTLLADPLTRRPTQSFEPRSFNARNRFLDRQVALLGAMVKWRKFSKLGEELIGRLVEAVIAPLVLGGWDVGGVECWRKVLPMIPPEVVPKSLQGK